MRTRSFSLVILATLSILTFAAWVMPSPTTPIARAAPAGAPLLQAATPTPAPTPIPPNPPLSTQYSPESVGLVAGLLALLGLLFVLLLWWSNKLDHASYLGSLYRDTIEEIEYGRLATALREKLETRQYHREVQQDSEWQAKLPDKLQEVAGEYSDDWGTGGWGTSSWGTGSGGAFSSDDYATAGSTGGGVPNLPPDPKVIARQQERQSNLYELQRKVDGEAKRRYQQNLSEARTKAKERARQAVSIDLGVLQGRGTEFVLEFTAVVVIIFTAFGLGVLRILDTQQIGTLLAAIAGYVLGRATTRGQGAEAETRTPVKTTELAELLKVVSGITQVAQSAPLPAQATLTTQTVPPAQPAPTTQAPPPAQTTSAAPPVVESITPGAPPRPS
ncbi:MAG: hypothetical protein WCF84_09560 [Anaerolineae bacterium]